MKKKNFLFMFLALVFALSIVPGVSMWLGFPTPSQGIANMFTTVLGEASLVNGQIAFSIVAVFIALVIFGALKIIRKTEKSS